MHIPGRGSLRRALAATLRGLLLLIVTTPAWGLAIDVSASADRGTDAATIASPTFSTTAANELLLAFVATDAATAGITVTGVSGAGLTWTLVKRANAQLGTAEIWRAFAPTLLSSVTITATTSQKVAASIAVVSFTGADPSGTGGTGAIGATGAASAASGAPSAALTTTRAGSWVFGVGNDWDSAVARTIGPAQTMVHQYLATAIGATYWMQRQSAPTASSGTSVTINDTAPTTDKFNLALVEVLPAPSGTTTVPGAPTIGAATAGNAQATVSFAVPASDGGAAITSYTATSNPGSISATVQAPAASITVAGLSNGTAYTFTVTASNANGAGAASAASNSVTPVGVPGAPTIGAATAGNGQASVSFAAPASNGGSALTGYTATSTPGNISASVTAPATSITVPGLVNGTAYRFTVTASNINGAGAASAASNSVTPSTIPGSPTIGTATAGNAQATVAFTAPASNGGATLTSYTALSSPGSLTATVAAPATTVTIPGLTNGTPYTFTVTASNINGPGAASGASNLVTPTAGAVTISVTPTLASVQAGSGSAQFAATVTNTANTAVTWQVNGVSGGNATVGTISTAGLYRAPATVPAPPTVTATAVSAADPTKTASATVTVTAATAVSVSVSPALATLTLNQSQQFTATVSGGGPAATWTASGGTIDPVTGLYSPPATAGVYTVIASSGGASASASVAVTDLSGIYTFHYDAARTGQNLHEYALTPATVSNGNFGKRWSCAVDGDVYAQPLYVANLAIGGTLHNVVFVATEHDSVYAFDADSGSCTPLWQRSFLGTGVTSVLVADNGNCADISPEYGVTGTPVIDPATATLYVVAKTKEASGIVQRLHALSLASGAELAGFPIALAASISNASNATVNFTPLSQNQRAGLVFAAANAAHPQGAVYIAFASHCDFNTWHGWVLGYDVATTSQFAVFNSTPNGSQGGIWMSGAAPAVDATGSLFLSTGNGSFTDSGNTLPAGVKYDFGESFVKLDPLSLGVADYYTPSAEAAWSSQDLDISSAGITALPDGAGPPGHPNVLVGGSKQGYFWMIDRNVMSEFNNPDKTVQFMRLPIPGTTACGTQCIFSSPAYWNGTVYVDTVDGALLALPLTNGLMPVTSTTSGSPATPTAVPASRSAELYPPPGTTPVISAAGPTANAIVWAMDINKNGDNATFGPAILRAYDATNLGTTLYSSSARPFDAGGPAIKFTVPVVANGHVYIGGASTLTVYGMGTPPLLGDPTIESLHDSNTLGHAEAFQVTATASGTITRLWVYVDSTSTAGSLVAGIYTDAAKHPATLLSQGTATTLTAGAWNSVTLPGAVVSSGTPYWIAILGTKSGTLQFRDGSGGCSSESSAQTTLTALPATWSSGPVWTSCPLSAYGTTGP